MGPPAGLRGDDKPAAVTFDPCDRHGNECRVGRANTSSIWLTCAAGALASDSTTGDADRVSPRLSFGIGAPGCMNLRQLQYFVAVAEGGGFRQAATRLRVAQPALSRQIQGMEAELGLTLLDRDSRPIVPTPAGEAYLRSARSVLTDVARAVRRARLANDGHMGRCVIAAPRPALASGYLSRTAEHIALHYPEIELVIAEADIPDQWERLRRGEVDLLVGLRSPTMDGIATEPLWRDNIHCALLPAGHALAHRASVRLAELRDDELLVADPSVIPELWASMEQALQRAGISRAHQRIVRSMSGVRAQVAAGHGWSLVSATYLEEPPTGTAVVEVDDFSVDAVYAAQWRESERRCVVTVVREVLRAMCSEGRDATVLASAGELLSDRDDSFGIPRALELRQLEYLRAAVTSASIGAAADAMGIAQPALSRQLRDLERTLGVELLERSARGVRPTAAGDVLVRETNQVASNLADAVHAASRAHRGAHDQCLLATISTPMGIHVVASVLAECARTDPSLTIEIVEMPSIAQRAALLSATMDVGFSMVSSMDDGEASIVHEHMLDDPLDCVLVARDHPLAARDRVRLAELGALPFLFAPRDVHPTFHDQVLQRLRRLELRSPVDTTYQALHLRWARAAEGKGWCLGFRSQRVHPPRGTVALGVDGLTIPWGMELLWRAGEDREMVLKLIATFRRASAVMRRDPAFAR
jgi:DNA-binding transcriptional LysR family regulator